MATDADGKSVMRRMLVAVLVAGAAALSTAEAPYAAGAIGIVPDDRQLNANVLEFGGDGANDAISFPATSSIPTCRRRRAWTARPRSISPAPARRNYGPAP